MVGTPFSETKKKLSTILAYAVTAFAVFVASENAPKLHISGL